ncbi:cytochrome P450 [Dichomitus squalens]|uniref:Cytochrome P450 n=1 Tax=Dichomitus squalens TaxID=114155 RepID=A0A4Q9Q8M3_9APHY|nr:cytochrome P450 [Dichomitus squalens]
MSEDNVGTPLANSVGLVTQSPLAFALVLVGLYWAQKIIRGADSSRPPRTPYWIPWVGNAVEMGKDPDGFFSNMTKTLGPIFRVTTLGQERVFVTSPSLISQVYRDSQNFDFLAVRVEIGRQAFSIDDRVGTTPYMFDNYMPALHHILLPANIKSMTSTYLQSAHDTLVGAISSLDGASGPLKTIIIPPAYRAAAHAGFGPDFPAEKTWKGFTTFDESFHMINAGLPRFLFRKQFKAWEGVTDIIQAYLEEKKDEVHELSPFLQAALDGRQAGWTERDISIILATQLWALQANAIWAAYWLVAELLQQPDGLAPLVAELDAVRKQWQAAHPSTPFGPAFFDDMIVSNPKDVPLLSSAIQETLRYSSSTFSMRHVTAPVQLGGYELRPGDKVICVTRQTHLDEDIYPRANELDIRRYLDPPRPVKDGKPVPNHFMAFGGGVSMCEGRHFAMTELRLFVAILLTYATLEVDEGCTTRPELSRERMGLGIMHANGDMDVILRKRKL